MMKTFLKIAGAIALLLLLFIIGLNLYFTDDRLRDTLMPYINESVGRTVEVESMSVTFLSTFPKPGITLNKLRIPDQTESDTLLALEELTASVDLFPLFRNEVHISELSAQSPYFNYTIYPDSTTNIDFFFEEEQPADTSSSIVVDIPYFELSEGTVNYHDQTSELQLKGRQINGDLSLSYDELINNSMHLEIGALSAIVDSASYFEDLAFTFDQESTIDTEAETLALDEGTLSVRGLSLQLAGSMENWSTKPSVDLSINSSSDNIGELLLLVPPEYEEQVRNLETNGSFAINGTIKGTIDEELPRFDLAIEVNDGFIQNPDLPQPIENINLEAQATNDLITIATLSANAENNRLSGSGTLNDPLEEDGTFVFDFITDLNLSTLHQFYDISTFDIEEMSGQLNVDATAEGKRNAPEEITFDGLAKLTEGTLKFIDVPKTIENITIDAQGTQSEFNISDFRLQAGPNTFDMQGTINYLFDENQRTIDLNTNLDFDLATLKEFYPIDEDTLKLRGQLTANASLNGKAEQIEQAVQKGTIKLSDGLIQHQSLDNPIQEITFSSTLDGPTLNISEASFITGDNNLSADGTVTNYLSDNRSIDLNISGKAMLEEITNYYDLEPGITTLNGAGDLNIRARGPLSQPDELQLNGGISLQEVNMAGDNLVQPVSNLNGKLKLNPQNATLSSLNFNLGSSDISIQGTLTDYMAYLKNPNERSSTPRLQGSFSSSHLNLDELIDWTDTTRVEMPIHLPDLRSTVDADIKEMILTGITMTNVQGNASTTPEQIALDQATANLLGGTVTGSLTWDVLRPDQTTISFSGNLDNLRAGSFFEEYPVLGEKSKLHQYVEGTFSAEVDYESGLNVYLEPQLPTSTMKGTFGMSKAVLEGHPVQVKLADRLNAGNLKRMALDKWESSYNLKDRLFTINDLSLTSGNIGVELNGNKHLVSEVMDYQMTLYLPSRFDKAIASVISDRALKALKQEDGTTMLPLRVSGSPSNINVTPDQEVIEPKIKNFFKDKGRDVLKNIFNRNAPKDTTNADTTSEN